jgi:hypothetical protein
LHFDGDRVACAAVTDSATLTRPRIGVIVDEPRALRAVRKGDQVDRVILRASLLNMPRASGARSFAESAGERLPGAELWLYAWHYLSYIKSDGLAARASRKIEGKEFGHLRDTPEVQRAWETTLIAAEAAGAQGIVIKTPPSFSTSAVNRQRLRDFVAAHKRDGYELAWEADGLWTDESIMAFAPELGVMPLIGVPLDAVDGSRAPAWLKLGGEIRASRADQLAYTLEDLDVWPELMFDGPSGFSNARTFARIWADSVG